MLYSFDVLPLSLLLHDPLDHSAATTNLALVHSAFLETLDICVRWILTFVSARLLSHVIVTLALSEHQSPTDWLEDYHANRERQKQHQNRCSCSPPRLPPSSAFRSGSGPFLQLRRIGFLPAVYFLALVQVHFVACSASAVPSFHAREPAYSVVKSLRYVTLSAESPVSPKAVEFLRRLLFPSHFHEIISQSFEVALHGCQHFPA